MFGIHHGQWKDAREPNEREHTTPFMWSNPSFFRIGNVTMPEGRNLFMRERWTVDFEEDFEFVKKIYENLYKGGRIFLMEEILKFLEKRNQL